MFAVKVNVKMITTPLKALGPKIDKAHEKALRKSGPKVRGIMRRNIKFRKKKKSEPGKPPFAHTRGFGLKTIVYKYFPPAGLRSPYMDIGPIVRADDVPGKLEKGGRIGIRTKKGRVTAIVKPRPFAAPAFETYVKRYPEEWRNIIK